MNDLFDTIIQVGQTHDPSTSQCVEQLDIGKMEMLVLKQYNLGKTGCISDDVLKILSHHRYSVTARYQTAKEKGLVIVVIVIQLKVVGCS